MNQLRQETLAQLDNLVDTIQRMTDLDHAIDKATNEAKEKLLEERQDRLAQRADRLIKLLRKFIEEKTA